MSDRTGAGLIAAYGFKSKRIAVAQPLVRTSPFISRNAAKPASVFRQFKKILREVAGGEVDLYIEFRSRLAADGNDRLQVVASGFTWRINVNRPCEKTYPNPNLTSSFMTDGSQEVYQIYQRLILPAAEENLDLYVDIHQYGADHSLQVATVGVHPNRPEISRKKWRNSRSLFSRESLRCCRRITD